MRPLAPPASWPAPSTAEHVCAAPSNQFEKYYYEGRHDHCPTRFVSWQRCLQSKVTKPEDAEAILREDWKDTVPGTHLWAFRPEYAAEAYGRYGVRPPEAAAYPEARTPADRTTAEAGTPQRQG